MRSLSPYVQCDIGRECGDAEIFFALAIVQCGEQAFYAGRRPEKSGKTAWAKSD
jgi:hypothetical protein